MEEWRPVVGFEGIYEVSNLGRVRRSGAGKGTRIGKILNPTIPRNPGYPVVALSLDGVQRPLRVHRLVARAFLGEPPTAMHVVNHKDGVRTNNSAANLEWITQRGNIEDAITRGSHPGWHWTEGRIRGEAHPKSRLTAAQVREIRALLTTTPMAHIARQFGVRPYSIQMIRDRKSWTHID